MFGQYKNSLTSTLVRNYTNKKNFKKYFHGVMQPLKENKIAREFFVLYGEIENKKFDDKSLAEEYLNSVIKTLKNKKGELKVPQIKQVTGIDNKIYSKLDSLVFNESVKAIENNLINKRDLLEHLISEDKHKKIGKPVPMSLLNNLIARKFNEKYSYLSEEDTAKLKNLLSMDKNEVERKVTELKESTLSKLQTLKEDSEDKDMKNKIQEVCDSVNESDINSSSILKIEKLNKSLIK